MDTNNNILLIGDLILDHYLIGSCNQISPEAPVPVVKIKNEIFKLGGAGNVLRNLISFEMDVDLMSILGDCENTKKIKELLCCEDTRKNYIFYEKNRISSRKTRILSAQQQVVRFDQESVISISQTTENKILHTLSNEIENYNLVVLSDYDKGLLTPNLIKQIINISNKHGVRVIVDPKGNDYSKYLGAYLITPNKTEASIATGIKISNNSDLRKCLSKLKKICNVAIPLITLSEEGIAILDDDVKIFPTRAKEVFDVTGAGDTVISAIAYGLVKNFSIDRIIQFANDAAGAVVAKLGASTTNLKEINLRNSEKSSLSKFISIDELNILIRRLKKSGKKITFTNGCFDILHLGHVNYLEKASNLGDVLIVGINSDESIKKIKGSNRPINSLEDRIGIIASLSSVDYVVTFNEETPINLIKSIKPEFLVKGADYKKREVVGSEFAKEVILIEFIQGKSTTNLISQIKSS